MDIRSILVNVDPDPSNSTTLRYAVSLATMLDARLIGVAAEQPNLAFVGIDGGAAAVDFYAAAQADIDVQLRRCEEFFIGMAPPSLRTEWRAYMSNPLSAIIDSAHAADMIVTGAKTVTTLGETQRVNLGELIVSAGRPVLNVGDGVSEPSLRKVMIAWKDRREARRAVSDAMPLLERATEVVAVTISEGENLAERRSLNELVGWMAEHGIAVRSDIVNSREWRADIIEETAKAHRADLVVSGGYGHSRAQEWLFGGVTRNLLGANSLNRLFSN